MSQQERLPTHYYIDKPPPNFFPHDHWLSLDEVHEGDFTRKSLERKFILDIEHDELSRLIKFWGNDEGSQVFAYYFISELTTFLTEIAVGENAKEGEPLAAQPPFTLRIYEDGRVSYNGVGKYQPQMQESFLEFEKPGSEREEHVQLGLLSAYQRVRESQQGDITLLISPTELYKDEGSTKDALSIWQNLGDGEDEEGKYTLAAGAFLFAENNESNIDRAGLWRALTGEEVPNLKKDEDIWHYFISNPRVISSVGKMPSEPLLNHVHFHISPLDQIDQTLLQADIKNWMEWTGEFVSRINQIANREVVAFNAKNEQEARIFITQLVYDNAPTLINLLASEDYETVHEYIFRMITLTKSHHLRFVLKQESDYDDVRIDWELRDLIFNIQHGQYAQAGWHGATGESLGQFIDYIMPDGTIMWKGGNMCGEESSTKAEKCVSCDNDSEEGEDRCHSCMKKKIVVVDM